MARSLVGDRDGVDGGLRRRRPVQIGGRIIAAIVMIVGIGFLVAHHGERHIGPRLGGPSQVRSTNRQITPPPSHRIEQRLESLERDGQLGKS